MEYTKEYLQQLVDNGIQEGSHLEYKAAGAFGKNNDKKVEITKDVSAFANSAGGVLICGIREYSDSNLKHLPEQIDPVDQSVYKKEWLDQITALIQPRIQGLKIILVHVGPKQSDYCYIVEVPQSDTAHQALDRKYYKRRNFLSEPMEDYEIRDVMNRRKHPDLTAEIWIESTLRPEAVNYQPERAVFHIRVRNVSRVIARHYMVMVHMPLYLSSGRTRSIRPVIPSPQEKTKDGLVCWQFSFGNENGLPLFPDSIKSFQMKLDDAQSRSVPNPIIPDIRITLYADEMEKKELTKDLALAEQGWV